MRKGVLLTYLTYCMIFVDNFDFEGKIGKNVENFGFLSTFSKIRKSEIVVSPTISPTNSTSCRVRQLIVALKLQMIPVNPYFSSKSAEHDVTLTSLTANPLHLFSLRIGICSPQIGRLHWCRQLGYHSGKGRLIST